MFVIKHKGKIEKFSLSKISNAVERAYESCGEKMPSKLMSEIKAMFKDMDSDTGDTEINVEQIRDMIEGKLISVAPYCVAKAFIINRYRHGEEKSIKERVRYMKEYQTNGQNAATSSASDPNANMNLKNVANLESEVYKPTNRKTQRIMLFDSIRSLYSERLAKQYLKDLTGHLIYAHDEASTPVLKNYCEAVSLYPILSGTSSLDGTGTKPPKNLQSFCGQLINTTFLLAGQCKGAVAFGEFFNFFDHFCVMDFGENYDLNEKEMADSEFVRKPKTIGERIEQMFQYIVYNWNQPAGNRGNQSPFTNISYYDENYWHAMFDNFAFPDGSKPEWRRIDYLQRKFMKWFNAERSKTLLTFPVETMALLTDGKDVIDKKYKELNAEMYAEGHSFFTYLSDNPDSLASCCRLRNQITENVFSFTNGLTGVQTGSCNVITLNLNRMIQQWFREYCDGDVAKTAYERRAIIETEDARENLKSYLTDIIKRIHKYHVAYKTMLYDWEKNGMFTASKAGYISMKKLYSTIGLNGINEAAEYMGLKCTYNDDYRDFCHLITKTISDSNKEDGTKKFQFNTEFVPAESLSSKNYNWDKEDGYWVPSDRNLYNSYFYIASDQATTILDRFKLHGREFTDTLDGGVGLHCNLSENLTKEQYMKLTDFAIKVGCTYYTYNVPQCQCDKCGHIEKHHFDKCPNCGGEEVTDWTRVIGYLRPIKKFDSERFKEAKTRIYMDGRECPHQYEFQI